MSSGTNQERIEQNNLKLTQLKTKADNLPEYQDIEPVYGVSDYNILSSKVSLYSYSVIVYAFDNYISIQDYQNTASFKILKMNTDGTVEQIISTAEFGSNNYKVHYLGKDSSGKYYFARMNKLGSNTNVNIPVYVFNPTQGTFTQSTFSFRTPNWGYTDIVILGKDNVVGFVSKFIYKFDFDNLTYTTEEISDTYFSNDNSGGKALALNDTYITFGNSSTTRKIRNLNTRAETTISTNGHIISLITEDNSKIIYNKNLYYLNSNGTIGNLITSNIIGSEMQFTWLAGEYYLGGDGLYQFNDTNNTLTKVFNCTTYSMYNISGNNRVLKINNQYNTIIFSPDMSVIIAIKYDGIIYKSTGNIITVTTDKIVNNYHAYAADGSGLVGTMPNNGELNYTPSTSQQTIPAGYTSGGTVAAVSMTEQEIEQAETLATDILS